MVVQRGHGRTLQVTQGVDGVYVTQGVDDVRVTPRVKHVSMNAEQSVTRYMFIPKWPYD